MNGISDDQSVFFRQSQLNPCIFPFFLPRPHIVKPSYKYWSPYIGPFSQKDEFLFNAEHRKCNLEKDTLDFGCCKPTLDEVAELFETGSVGILFAFSFTCSTILSLD